MSESEGLFCSLVAAISEGAGISGRSSGRSGSSVEKRRLSRFFFLKGDLPDFSRVVFFSFGNYTFRKRVLKIHAVDFFLNWFFFGIFLHLHI